MEPFKLSKEDREAIRKQHDEATKEINDKKAEMKKGLQPIKKDSKNKKTT